MSKKADAVVFRIPRGGDASDCIALFPDIPWTVDETNQQVTSYMHVGQHGGANYNHVIKHSRPAMPDEYKPLANELRGIGYKLDIRKVK